MLRNILKTFTFTVCLAGLAAAQDLAVVLTKQGAVHTETVPVPGLDPAAQFSFLYSVDSLRALQPDSRVELELRQDGKLLLRKTLHAGDPDFYTQFRVASKAPAQLSFKASGVQSGYHLQINRWPMTPFVRAVPNHRWEDAQKIPLGKTIFASSDDAEYVPLPATIRKANAEDPAGTDWYQFEFPGGQPKLIFLQADLTERDQLPMNVSLFRKVDGKLQEYFDGEDPVTFPHEVQALPGNKFAPRLLKEKGTYYIAVRANHPDYKLRTRLYDPPPYAKPQDAVRTALDYILGAGDSWHANTPRRGGTLDRVSSVHQETSLCVACHTTHFPLRAQLYAARNGYPIVQRQQVQFLTERFYNNPRPFYGFENDATWARMISAAANVLGRMSHLNTLFEQYVSGEPRPAFHEGINGYLKLYYADRKLLPPDETNGNTPLVSAHEVAWYAWTSNHDPRLGDFISTGPVKNMIDLCYQTLALADIDPAKYKAQIAKNAERILSLQREDGQWSARLETNQPEVEFQTGHALWALHAAGIPLSNPQIAKGLQYLLGRQQIFGGWMDPRQSFENFRTPFRETQMSVLALSAYYPLAGRQPGWDTAPISALSKDPVALLEQLDQIWSKPSPAVMQQLVAAAASNDALIRNAAVEALGRIGELSPLYPKLLQDPSKIVQRNAAWALRQTYSRHSDADTTVIRAALNAADDRTRWGASRVFAQHFSALARRPEVLPALAKLADDPALAVRMTGIKAIWQFWFWTPDAAVKSQIEDVVLTSLGKPQHSWIESNLHDAIYNIADENIRYLYNNWVPLLGQTADRDKAIQGRLAIEARLAGKFAAVLERGSDFQKKQLLSALVEFPLRRADVYNLEAELSKPGPLVYSRIGNDIEQIAFFGESRDKMAAAITPLLDSPDAQTRMLAQRAVLLVRDNRFPEVNRIAGPAGPSTTSLLTKVKSIPDAAEVTRALYPPPPTAVASAKAGTKMAAAKLDEAYFRGYVEPILQKRGKDGYACVNCHATHTLFDGTWGTVRNVVDGADPENSPILRKPISSSESEGVTNASTLAHGGGIRFTKDSPEYNTILEWIKGAKD